MTYQGIIERVRAWLGIHQPPRHAELVWHVQAHRNPITSRPIDRGHPDVVYHIAKSHLDFFEICDIDGMLLLSFPRCMRLPAELFSELADAKARAATALQSQEPK